MTITSGPPYDWPFELFDPASFRVPEREVTKVYLHCDPSGSTENRGVALVEEINTWHRDDGWKGIRWHFVVDKEGNAVTGRPLEETPIIDASDMNGKSIVIAAHGMWPFTPIQLKTILVLCSTINMMYELERKKITFQALGQTSLEGVGYDSGLHGAARIA